MTTAPTRDTEPAPAPLGVEQPDGGAPREGRRLGAVVAAIAVAVVAVLMGAGLWARLVYDPTPGTHRITVVGDDARGKVVDARIDRFRGSPAPALDLVRTGDWIDQSLGWSRLASGRGRLTYVGAVDPTVVVRFKTGVDGGDARVVVDGTARPLQSLHAASGGRHVVRLHFDRRVPPASWALLVVLMALCVVPAGAALYALRRLARARGRWAVAGVVTLAAAAGLLAGAALWSQPSVLGEARRVDAADDLLLVLSRIGVPLATGVLAALVACAVLGVRAPRLDIREPTTARERWRLTLLLALVPLAGWIVLLLLFWPGLVNPDAIIQWFELDRTGLDNWHPYLFAVGLGGLRHVADTPALPVLLQVVGGSLVVGRVAAWTVWRGRSVWVTAAFLLLLLLVPATALFTITVWKDTAFAIALLALALVVWRIEDTRGRWLAEWRNVALAILTASAVWLTRHNGWPIVVGTIVLLLVFHRQWWRRLALAGAGTLAVALLVQIPLAQLLDVHKNVVPSIVYVQHIANQIDQGTELTRSERRFLSKIHRVDRRWPYDCHSIQATWSGPGSIPPPRFVDEESRLRSLAITLALRNPQAELDHLACASELIWKPSASDDETYFLEWSNDAGHVDYVPRPQQTQTIDRSIYDVTPTEDSASPRATAWIYTFVTQTLPVWVLRPAIYLYALLAAIAFAAWRRRSWRIWLISVPAILQTLSVVALTLVQDVRFQFGVTLTAVVLVPALLAVAPRRDADDRVPLRWGRQVPG